jgi:hypothetical protein
VHVTLTRLDTGDRPLEDVPIVAEEMLGWLRDIDGFEGMLTFSREGVTVGLTFWATREAAVRHRVARLEFLDRVMSVADLEVEERLDLQVTFAHLGPAVIGFFEGR